MLHESGYILPPVWLELHHRYILWLGPLITAVPDPCGAEPLEEGPQPEAHYQLQRVDDAAELKGECNFLWYISLWTVGCQARRGFGEHLRAVQCRQEGHHERLASVEKHRPLFLLPSVLDVDNLRWLFVDSMKSFTLLNEWVWPVDWWLFVIGSKAFTLIYRDVLLDDKELIFGGTAEYITTANKRSLRLMNLRWETYW